MFKAHIFDVLSDISGKENTLVLFWRTITESLLSSNGGFYTFWKRVLFRLLVLVVRDSVVTLSAIAYNVNSIAGHSLPCVLREPNYQKPFSSGSRCHKSVCCSLLKCIGTETSWSACWRKLKVSIPCSIPRWRLLFSVRHSIGILVLRGHRSLSWHLLINNY